MSPRLDLYRSGDEARMESTRLAVDAVSTVASDEMASDEMEGGMVWIWQ